jgi:MSHA biogenesis protein MshL
MQHSILTLLGSTGMPILRCSVAACALLLVACAEPPKHSPTLESINAELKAASEQKRKPTPQPEAVSQALLPPLIVEMPKTGGKPVEQKFDLVVNNAPAREVFMALVSGTRYSMLVPAEVKDNISVNLKDVTLLEALDTIREIYGYEYKVEGSRVFIESVSLQTRVFKVNYLVGQREGKSDIRVTSGSVSDSGSSSSSGTTSTSTSSTGPSSQGLESSRITTSSGSNFWVDLEKTLKAVVGSDQGRSVIMSPQSGIIVVRAFPSDMRNVERFLKATQIAVERQVMLEAKIIEVVLNEGYQSGINWAAFSTGSQRASIGQIAPGTTLSPTGSISTSTQRAADGSLVANSSLTANPGVSLLTGAATLGGLFGLAFQTASFAALINFLETHGNVHVLSSPRIATLNNQKAVLKVGVDEFFVTNVTTNTSTTGTTSTVSPTITVQPFFSGIALDVTPQIGEDSNIILHIHPSVSQVAEKAKNIDLGTLGQFVLPLASSSINETDSIVRVQDANIVAIGGLMRQQYTDDASQVPGLGSEKGLGKLFRQNNRKLVKSELVILIKPTVIHSDESWQKNILESQQRVQEMSNTYHGDNSDKP